VDHVNAKQTLKLVEARRLAASGEGKAVREGAGLSLHEVAAAISLSVSGLFRWENGERIPRGERAVAWAEFLEQLAAARRAS
jgi:DNA-binding transcriptional regulator YiaG